MISSCWQLSETWVTRAIYYACNVHDGINLNSIDLARLRDLLHLSIAITKKSRSLQ